jgi:hypothetical protein
LKPKGETNMAITYTWTIANCEHDIATGGINVVHWRVTAEDGEYNVTAYGTVGLTPDPSSPDFVPYADVTESQAIVWVWGQVDKIMTESNLKAQIEAQKNPTEASGLPWA